MTEANTKDGLDLLASRLEEGPQVVHSLSTLDRVSGAVAQKEAVVLALRRDKVVISNVGSLSQDIT